MTNEHSELHTGYNDLKQIEMSVQAAQKMTGSATMSLDTDALNNAKKAIQAAWQQFDGNDIISGADEAFLSRQKELLQQCEHQITEASQNSDSV